MFHVRRAAAGRRYAERCRQLKSRLSSDSVLTELFVDAAPGKDAAEQVSI